MKIIQILIAPVTNEWQGQLLGLSDEGITYECDSNGYWVEFVSNVMEREIIE